MAPDSSADNNLVLLDSLHMAKSSKRELLHKQLGFCLATASSGSGPELLPIKRTCQRASAARCRRRSQRPARHDTLAAAPASAGREDTASFKWPRVGCSLSLSPPRRAAACKHPVLFLGMFCKSGSAPRVWDLGSSGHPEVSLLLYLHLCHLRGTIWGFNCI